MARQIKSGIDYFPLDVSMDDSMKLIEAQFGLKGFAIVVKLWQKIYGGEGYYCEWTEEIALLFKKEVALDGNVVSDIVDASIRRGIFDKDKFDKYGILTSKGIQKRYFEAVNRRKAIKVKKQYLLIDVDINKENVNICPLQIDIVERIINRYSNEGDTVYDPFAGLFTVPMTAVKLNREGIGVELNTDYFLDGVAYCKAADEQRGLPTLFDVIGDEQ